MIERIYIRWDWWEEYHFGLWRNVYGEERDKYLKMAIRFTGNAELYGKYMLLALRRWPYSCTNNLSNTSINRQAWIGHAACCIAIGCPEDITRLAWHELTQEQQDLANHKADIAIATWEQYFHKGVQLCLNIASGLTYAPQPNNE